MQKESILVERDGAIATVILNRPEKPNAPLVARWHKKFARRLADPAPLTEAEYLEAFDCFDTEDFRTGYQAFLARQKPRFSGR